MKEKIVFLLKSPLKKHMNLTAVFLTDILLVCISWFVSFSLRFNFDIPASFMASGMGLLPAVVLIKIVVFYFFHVYRGMWRYTSLTDLINIVKAAVFSTLLLIFTVLLFNRFQGFSRSIFIIDGTMTILLISGSRILLRLFFELKSGDNAGKTLINQIFGMQMRPADAINLIIVGAGNAGEKICREIRENTGLKYFIEGEFLNQLKRHALYESYHQSDIAYKERLENVYFLDFLFYIF